MIPRANGRVPRDRPIDKIVRFDGEGKQPAANQLLPAGAFEQHFLQKTGVIPRAMDNATDDYLPIRHLVQHKIVLHRSAPVTKLR